MKTFKAEGFVIKRRNFGEADRIITIFLKKGGKITAKAPGTRKITSRRSSHIELLNYSNFSFYNGKNMPVLTEAATIDSFPTLKNDLKKIGYSYHMCEILDGLCPENQDHPEIFCLIGKTLKELTDSSDLEESIKKFDLEILRILGYFDNQKEGNNLNTALFIEQILEKKLKSREINSKLTF